MSILIKIYLYSVAGACAYVVLFNVVFAYLHKNDKLSSPELHFLKSWADTPMRIKIVLVFIPLLNCVYAILAVLLILGQIWQWYIDLGRIYIRKATKSMKHFELNNWIVYYFWHSQLDYFYDLINRGQVKEMNELIKTCKEYNDKIRKQDEKDKREREQAHTEPDCKDQKAATKGPDDNSAAGA
jgi:hypothetical protein